MPVIDAGASTAFLATAKSVRRRTRPPRPKATRRSGEMTSLNAGRSTLPTPADDLVAAAATTTRMVKKSLTSTVTHHRLECSKTEKYQRNCMNKGICFVALVHSHNGAVRVPSCKCEAEWTGVQCELRHFDFAMWSDNGVYTAGVTAGIVLGFMVLFAAVVGGSTYCWFKKKRSAEAASSAKQRSTSTASTSAAAAAATTTTTGSQRKPNNVMNASCNHSNGQLAAAAGDPLADRKRSSVLPPGDLSLVKETPPRPSAASITTSTTPAPQSLRRAHSGAPPLSMGTEGAAAAATGGTGTPVRASFGRRTRLSAVSHSGSVVDTPSPVSAAVMLLHDEVGPDSVWAPNDVGGVDSTDSGSRPVSGEQRIGLRPDRSSGSWKADQSTAALTK